jgi:hypothetical protein
MKILYWSQLTFDSNVFNPVLFFKPDLGMITYNEQFGPTSVPILISGTNGIYDGLYYATISKATSLGGCPPDFCSAPLVYSATLPNTSFTIYPYEPFIGEVFIANTMVYNLQEDEKKPKEIENTKEDYCGCGGGGGVKKIKNEYEEEVEESYTGPKPSSTPKSSPKPPDCLQNNNVFIFIICFFLILIIILILCFYGDLRSSTAPQRRLR